MYGERSCAAMTQRLVVVEPPACVCGHHTFSFYCPGVKVGETISVDVASG